MTSTAHEAFVATNRPVRRFVAVLAGVALLFALLGWSALAAPRLTGEPGTDGVWDYESREGSITVPLRNAGPFPIWLESVDGGEPISGLTDVALDGVPLERSPGRIASGDAAVLTARFSYHCDEEGPAHPVVFRAAVRTAIGIEREMEIRDSLSSGSICTHPADLPPDTPSPLADI